MSRTIDRTKLCGNSPHCSTKWINLPPTRISWRSKIASGKGWLSKLCGRRGMFRGEELFGVTTLLSQIFLSIGRKGLCLRFRPYMAGSV